MRVSSIFAAVALLLTPAVADYSQWAGETTITLTSSFSTTVTITKTLAYANQTDSSFAKPTGWNMTSISTSSLPVAVTTEKPTLPVASITTTYAGPSVASATGAAPVTHLNLAVAAVAGAVAMAWGSL